VGEGATVGISEETLHSRWADRSRRTRPSEVDMDNSERSGGDELDKGPSLDLEHEVRPSRSAPEIESRMERLIENLLWVGDPDVARSLRGFSDSALKDQPQVIRTAFQALKRRRDPAAFIGRPQYRLIAPLVAEALSEECLDAVVVALGESADHPDREHLDRALASVRGQFPVSTVALMLAYVSVTDMDASDLCDELLTSDDSLKVPPSGVAL